MNGPAPGARCKALLAVIAGAAAVGPMLTGCQGTGSRSGIAPIGTVEVLQPVTIPANRARATFQDGKPVDGGEPYNLYCELEISTVSAQAPLVEKDLFAVTRTGSAFISDADSRLPISGPFVEVNCGDLIFYEVDYRIASDLQPGVRKIRCLQGFNACEGGVANPDRESIAAALGPTFLLR